MGNLPEKAGGEDFRLDATEDADAGVVDLDGVGPFVPSPANFLTEILLPQQKFCKKFGKVTGGGIFAHSLTSNQFS